MADKMPYSTSVAAQAMAASWAASCCHEVKQHTLQAEFHILHVFFSAQYGLDQIDVAHGQLNFASKPGHSVLGTAVAFLVDTQALRQHHKPGGWSAYDWKMLLRHLENSRPAAGGSLMLQSSDLCMDMEQELKRHKTWCQHLKHALLRYILP